MKNLTDLFTSLDERHGLLAAGLTLSSIAAFFLALKDGFHIANRTLMISSALFFAACAVAIWHTRDQSSVTYHGERHSLYERLRHVSWRSIVAAVTCLAAAAFSWYIARTGGQFIPH